MSQWNDPESSRTRKLSREELGQYGGQPQGQPQGQYGPAGYGQPQYGQPQQPGRPRYQDSTANPFGAASDSAFGIVSSVLALLGGIVGIVSLTGLDWFTNSVSFGDVHDGLNALGDQANGFSKVYFSWLAWAFLIVAVIAAIMASFPSPALRAFRVIGVVVGVAAAGLSFLALQLGDNSSWTTNFEHARIGFYLLVIAYLLAGIGAGIGPRRV